MTGFGHLYLRRWRRAAGWLAVLFAVSYVFVEPAAIDGLAAGEPVDPLSVAPTLLVGVASVADAYVLARAQNAVAQTGGATATRAGDAAAAGAGASSGETVNPSEEAIDSCPNCGKEVDPTLNFCHWCSADLPGGAETGSRGGEPERSER